MLRILQTNLLPIIMSDSSNLPWFLLTIIKDSTLDEAIELIGGQSYHNIFKQKVPGDLKSSRQKTKLRTILS